ncbi:hypothetical protein [Streptomyces paradoxus]|uniref:Uncharacterized protein n=1 Tax=Streptomyces paradoxus TaxID=66375 RepID=A0A7W9TI21_9ACTN|nr:hypothetical protein [Streptomyces paradoxus]MBB6081120.1 hypothetical protein [Streptomyces paradoxus]
MDMARLGTIAATVITVLAALGGLVLGIRAEQRAIKEEERAAQAEQRAKSEERRAIRDEARARDEQQQASERDKSTYARRVDFYRDMNTLTVVNGSTRIMDVRLVLKDPEVWWDLQALPPCQQFDIPTGLLMSAMSAKEPWVRKHLTEQDLSRLRLEILDPNGKVWRRDSGGLVKQAEDWAQKPKGVRLVSDEPWHMKPEKSPFCG